MHLLLYTLKKHLHFGVMSAFLVSSCLLLVACSVEQQQSPTQSEIFTEQDENQEQDEIREKPKKPTLSRAQLFSGVLDSHNRVRAKHRLKPLKWSDKLTRYSQEWANQLGSGSRCTMRHRSGQPPYGENLYWSSAIVWSNGKRETNRVTIKDVVKAWTDEERWYNYQRNSCQPGQKCGHYTQVVWKNTTEVGCAVKVCNDKSQTWVCSYNPPGNFTGVRPY